MWQPSRSTRARRLPNRKLRSRGEARWLSEKTTQHGMVRRTVAATCPEEASDGRDSNPQMRKHAGCRGDTGSCGPLCGSVLDARIGIVMRGPGDTSCVLAAESELRQGGQGSRYGRMLFLWGLGGDSPSRRVSCRLGEKERGEVPESSQSCFTPSGLRTSLRRGDGT